MSRLRHSPRGFIRSLQLSKTDLFAFVEGWSDRFFYDRICAKSCEGSDLTFEVRTAQELPDQTGGKAALLSFFSYLRRRRLLLHEFKGKKSAVIFLLDKDIDDVLGTRKRSRHVIYTEYFQLENYLIRHAEIAEIAAAAASLDVHSVRSIIGDQRQWMQKAATEWKQWVSICITARILQANCRCTYSLHSQINDGPYSGVVAADLALLTTELQTASGLPAAKLDRWLERTRRRIDRIYAAGRYDNVFKGKWYAHFLAEDIRRAAVGRAYNANGLGERIFSAAAAKLNFGEAWVLHFRDRLASVLQSLVNHA
jgi:hypothetical protein